MNMFVNFADLTRHCVKVKVKAIVLQIGNRRIKVFKVTSTASQQ